MTSEQLKIARSRLNWSQVRLAKELDLTVFTISRYERGDKIPRSVELAVEFILAKRREMEKKMFS